MVIVLLVHKMELTVTTDIFILSEPNNTVCRHVNNSIPLEKTIRSITTIIIIFILAVDVVWLVENVSEEQKTTVLTVDLIMYFLVHNA